MIRMSFKDMENCDNCDVELTLVSLFISWGACGQYNISVYPKHYESTVVILSGRRKRGSLVGGQKCVVYNMQFPSR